jgi:hypothetical protein
MPNHFAKESETSQPDHQGHVGDDGSGDDARDLPLGRKGCSYRTVQRFFGEQIPWVQLYWQFFVASCIARSESTCWPEMKRDHEVRQADLWTGPFLLRFAEQSGAQHCDLCAVADRCGRAAFLPDPGGTGHPQRSREKQAKKQQRKAKQKAKVKGKPGRPKGSKNRDKTQVALTEELLRIQKMVKRQLALFQACSRSPIWCWMDTLATTMPCRWFVSVICTWSPNCVMMLRCISSTKVSMRAKALPGSMATRSSMTSSPKST